MYSYIAQVPELHTATHHTALLLLLKARRPAPDSLMADHHRCVLCIVFILHSQRYIFINHYSLRHSQFKFSVSKKIKNITTYIFFQHLIEGMCNKVRCVAELVYKLIVTQDLLQSYPPAGERAPHHAAPHAPHAPHPPPHAAISEAEFEEVTTLFAYTSCH